MNVRPQVKQRAEEQASTMSTDQQAAIRILANDLHRLNQAVMQAVEAGVSVELVRSATASWRQRQLGRSADPGGRDAAGSGVGRPAVEHVTRRCRRWRGAMHSPSVKPVILRRNPRFATGVDPDCRSNVRQPSSCDVPESRVYSRPWRHQGSNPVSTRTGISPTETPRTDWRRTFPGCWSSASRRSTASWFPRSSNGRA